MILANEKFLSIKLIYYNSIKEKIWIEI
jgi:hypothetical protein